MRHLLSMVLLATSATCFANTSTSMDGEKTKCVLLCDSTVTTYVSHGRKSKTEYVYNEWGKKISTIQQNYKDGEWTPDNKTVLTYDQNGHCIYQSHESFHEDAAEEWGTTTDSVITVRDIIPKPDTIPLGAPKPESTLDEQGREICHIDYEDPGFFSNEWKYNKRESTYDDGGGSSCADYTWKNGAWVGNYKWENIQDNQGHLESESHYVWVNGAWLLDRKTEYNYDEQGNMTSELDYGRSESFSCTYKMDDEGRAIKIEYTKRGPLKVQSEKIYYYSTHTISIPETEDDLDSINLVWAAHRE